MFYSLQIYRKGENPQSIVVVGYKIENTHETNDALPGSILVTIPFQIYKTAVFGATAVVSCLRAYARQFVYVCVCVRACACVCVCVSVRVSVRVCVLVCV